jgi:hypothetical protein
MHHRPLSLAILAALGGCTDPNGPLVDGEYFIEADPAVACPAAADVEDQLLGDRYSVVIEEVTGEGTAAVRDFPSNTGGPAVPTDVCCYPTRQREQTGCVDGRPIRVDGEARVAPAIPVTGWGRSARARSRSGCPAPRRWRRWCRTRSARAAWARRSRRR